VVWAEEQAVEEIWAVEEANELRKQIKPIEPGVRDLNKSKESGPRGPGFEITPGRGCFA